MHRLLLIVMALSVAVPSGMLHDLMPGKASAEVLPFETAADDCSDSLELLKTLDAFVCTFGWTDPTSGDSVSAEHASTFCNLPSPVDRASHFCRPPPACGC